jgi:serine protease inhibitor
MLEGEYLELCDQLKERFEKNEIELIKFRNTNSTLMKEIMTSYGLIRIIDNTAENDDISRELKTLIECLRTHLSDFFDTIYLIKPPQFDFV